MLKKLLLPYTNPKIDRETEGEFSAEVFDEKAKNGESFEKTAKALE